MADSKVARKPSHVSENTLYTECKYGGPLGRPGTSSMEARPVSMSVAAFP